VTLPLLEDATVTVDAGSQSLTVRPASHAGAYTSSLWRDGLRQSRRRPGAVGTVWASADGKGQISFGVPEVRGDGLVFSFRRGDPVFWRLVSSPKLTARFAVDVTTHRIINVTFKGRR
jgi:hypothetical protein